MHGPIQPWSIAKRVATMMVIAKVRHKLNVVSYMQMIGNMKNNVVSHAVSKYPNYTPNARHARYQYHYPTREPKKNIVKPDNKPEDEDDPIPSRHATDEDGDDPG